MPRRWSFQNVPVPEGHVSALVLAEILTRRFPWNLHSGGPPARNIGWVALGAGITLIAWAVRAAGTERIADSRTLVTAGPYRYTRNPMYLGWAIIALAASIVRNSMWYLIALPAILGYTHAVVQREERRLSTQFPDQFASYRDRVPRYIKLYA